MSDASEEKAIVSAVLPERGDKTTRLEAFVDAAFAFAVTLLVISSDRLPRSVDDLIVALKNVPTFAASFILILIFWRAHADWSRRYGLDDAVTQRLSLLLVFLVLIFVFPLRMVFASLFALISHGWLPANFTLHAWTDVPALFVTYGVAYGALCMVMWLFFRHAWNSRIALGLAREERIATRMSQFKWALLVLIAGTSIVVALLILKIGSEAWRWRLGLPGFMYFGNNLLRPFARRYERRLRALDAVA